MKQIVAILGIVLTATPAFAGAYRQERKVLPGLVTVSTIAVTGFQPFQFVKVGLGPIRKQVTESSYCYPYFTFTTFSFPMQPTGVVFRNRNGDTQTTQLVSVPELAAECGKDSSGYKAIVGTDANIVSWTRPPIFRSKYDRRFYVSSFIYDFVTFLGTSEERMVRADGCGMVTLRESVGNRWSSTTPLSVAGTTYTVAGLPAGFLPKCVRTGNTYSVFLPN